MNKLFTILAASICINLVSAQTTITVMDSVIFHDGYAGYVTSPPPPLGAIKMRNDIFSRKLTNAEIESIGSKLQLNVDLSALCDNYDRIGNVYLALVPHDSAKYTLNAVEHIEIARFITPFMNKNRNPKTVPYTFNIENVALLLKDTELRKKYKFWIELAVFGVPYAANNEVAGCSGRNDVFMGKVELVTNSPEPAQNTNVLLPLYFNANFNNYQTGATDFLGETTKTLSFNIPNNLSDAAFFLITSNHGSNTGGEEYIRRVHNAYFDDELKLTYIPGRTTCEPFRKYNTQGNGIYGPTTRTPEQWQSFSNWCPGDVIDIRKISLGAVTAGSHTFTIKVPDATFVGNQGNFPLSLYFHGKTSGTLASVVDFKLQSNDITVYPNPTTTGEFTVSLSEVEGDLLVTDIVGNVIFQKQLAKNINNLQLEKSGVYFLSITTTHGVFQRKLVVN